MLLCSGYNNSVEKHHDIFYVENVVPIWSIYAEDSTVTNLTLKEDQDSSLVERVRLVSFRSKNRQGEKR